MFKRRSADDRGGGQRDWLDTRHTFSFGDYQDPEQMGFRSLRVINEDRVGAGKGFPMHGHANMEIFSFVLSGQLQHTDSTGRKQTISAGDLQVLSAGSGIRHSENNPSATDDVHFFQIWIFPSVQSTEPTYQFRPSRPDDGELNRLTLLAAPEEEENALIVRQDAMVYQCRTKRGSSMPMTLAPGRHGWLQLISGEIAVQSHGAAESHDMDRGDGIGISHQTEFTVGSLTDSHWLWFDLG